MQARTRNSASKATRKKATTRSNGKRTKKTAKRSTGSNSKSVAAKTSKRVAASKSQSVKASKSKSVAASKSKRVAATRTKRRAASPVSAGADKTAGVSNEAVRKATGRTWNEWCKLLDAAGCQNLDHKSIVAHVKKHDVSFWWQQMVTVGYEQARGLRDKHEKSTGYSISASKTIPVPIDRLYTAWSSARERRKWLGDNASFTVRKATPGKSMRITWIDGKTDVHAYFVHKGPSKSMIAVQHERLPSQTKATAMKKYWSQSLAQLKTFLD